MSNNTKDAGAAARASAVLAELSIRSWSGRARDAEVTDKVLHENKASPGVGAFNKLLLRKEALEQVRCIAREARDVHYALTLPWSTEGQRVLPVKNMATYNAQLDVLSGEFDAGVNAFIASYEEAKAAAKADLGGLYKESDYPSAGEVRSRFAFERWINPLPSGDALNVDLPKEALEELREKIEEQTRAAVVEAQQDAWRRIEEAVGRMSERLRTYTPGQRDGVFRDTLVTNIEDLVEVLPGLNVTGDPRLTEVINRMRSDLCEHSAQELRDAEVIRAKTAAKAEKILSKVKSFVQ